MGLKGAFFRFVVVAGENGFADLMVKFSGGAIQEILTLGEDFEMVLSGKLIDGRYFKAKDTIKVISLP